MDWLEISVQADDESAEAVIELFNRHGRGGAVVETPIDCFEYELSTQLLPSNVIVKAYLPLDGATASARRRLEEGLWHLAQIVPIPDPEIRELAEEDWANAWRKQYHAQRIGKRLLIVPVWETHDADPDQVVIRLEPGMAFGTGLHPTTRLCLQGLEQHMEQGCSLLDVGTGSGILAIAAAKLGARSVLALDADPVAVEVARENVALNDVVGIVSVEHGSLPGGDMPARFYGGSSPQVLEQGAFDLVVVNILAPVIMGMAPAIAARTRPGGRSVVAGLVDTQEADVVAEFRGQGLEVIARSQEKDWVSLVARRGADSFLPNS